MVITLRRSGTCGECGAELPAGSKAKWYRNGKVYGLTCHTRGDGAVVSRAPYVSWKATEQQLRSIDRRRDGLAFLGAHTGDTEKEAKYQEALRKLEAESEAVWDAYYRAHPEKDHRRKTAPAAAAEDYPCSDAGYEDACARACGL